MHSNLELLDVCPLAIRRLDDGGLDDLDRATTSSVAGGHVGVWRTIQKVATMNDQSCERRSLLEAL